MQASRYSANEKLRDGSPVEVRALQPMDREALLGAVGRMGEESIRRRFFAPKAHFSALEIERFVNVDFVTHVALVAVVPGDGRTAIVGGGRYIVTAPGVAEVAVAVEDAYQGRGIGGLLVRHLVALAQAAGLRELVAEVLAHNVAMLKVFRSCGLDMQSKHAEDVVHVTLRLGWGTALSAAANPNRSRWGPNRSR